MKNIIIITFILCYSFVNGQNSPFNKDSIANYFIKSLDSIRNNLFPGIDNLIIDKDINNACKHHNTYMSEMIKPNSAFISHTECKSSIGFVYSGNDTIIPSFIDRVKYYDVDSNFSALNEVISFEYHSYWKTQNVSNKFMGSVFINNFMGSPTHKEILTGPRYVVVGIDVYIDDEKMYVTVIKGGVVEKINDKEFSICMNNKNGIKEIKIIENQ